MRSFEFSTEQIFALIPSRTQLEYYDSSTFLPGSFGVRVNASGKKVFFYIYSFNGRRRRMTLGHFPVLSLEQAREQALGIAREVAAGHDPAVKKRLALPFTFGELVSRFLDDPEIKKLKASTLKEYQRIAKTELLPLWSETPLINLNSTSVNSLILHISETRAKAVMAKRTAALLSRILSYAKKKGFIEKSPLVFTEISPTQPKPIRILTDLELKSLWEILETESLEIQGIFKLLLLTGQRPSELLQMRWEDINFDTWKVTERRGTTPHLIYLSHPALEILRELRNVKNETKFVFSSKGNGHISYIRKAAKRLNEKMDCSRSWSPFDLRRTVEFKFRTLSIRPDTIEAVLNRRFSLPRRQIATEFDYFPEIKKALILWGTTLLMIVEGITPKEPPEKSKGKDGGAKVISLFK